jgi:hypothetical protein
MLNKVAILHILLIVPNVTVGTGLLVITTSSVDAGQGLLLIVHLNVAELPAERPDIVEVFDESELMVAAPETIDHAPVPGPAAVAAIVKVPLLHLDISGPALAILGGAEIFKVSGYEVEHPLPFLMVKVKP